MTATPMGEMGGMHMMVVSIGTRITDERSGQTIIVDDETVAVKGSVMWLTQAMFDRLRSRMVTRH